jgi:hypothetical protein
LGRLSPSPGIGDNRVSESAGSRDRFRLRTDADGDESYATGGDGQAARLVGRPVSEIPVAMNAIRAQDLVQSVGPAP